MKREKFIKIIRLRSFWKIDKRIGNYKLPDGSRLSDYVERLVRSQMKLDHLAIRENGNLAPYIGGTRDTESNKIEAYQLMPAFESNETCSYDNMEKRISILVSEIIE